MRFLNGRVIIGLVILVIGVLLLLERFELLEFEVKNIFDYWPVIPIVIGLNWLIQSFQTPNNGEGSKFFFSWGQFLSAIILISLGVIFLGRNLGLIDEEYTRMFWQALWPIILIILGLSLMRGRSSNKGGNRLAFMGGIDMGKSPWNLESGNYFAFMGGVDLDLTTAEIPEGETILDLTAFMGGIDVKIPKGLPVIYEGFAFLGGVTFLGHEDGGIITNRKVEHNMNQEADKRLLRIQSRAVMGGIDIKEKYTN